MNESYFREMFTKMAVGQINFISKTIFKPNLFFKICKKTILTISLTNMRFSVHIQNGLIILQSWHEQIL